MGWDKNSSENLLEGCKAGALPLRHGDCPVTGRDRTDDRLRSCSKTTVILHIFADTMFESKLESKKTITLLSKQTPPLFHLTQLRHVIPDEELWRSSSSAFNVLVPVGLQAILGSDDVDLSGTAWPALAAALEGFLLGRFTEEELPCAKQLQRAQELLQRGVKGDENPAVDELRQVVTSMLLLLWDRE